MIDEDLQKECRNLAIKKVAKNRNTTQKHIKEILNRGYNRDMNIQMRTVKFAVANWTVELYNREMQKRYLKND